MFDKNFDPLTVLEELAQRVAYQDYKYTELMHVVEVLQRQLNTACCKINEQSMLINRQSAILNDISSHALQQEILKHYVSHK